MTPEDVTQAAERHAEEYQQAIDEIATRTMRNAMTYACNDLLRVATEHPPACPCSTCALLALLVKAYNERAPSE